MRKKQYKQNSIYSKANTYVTLSILFWIPTIIYFIAFTQGFHFDGIFHLLPFIPGLIGINFWRKYAALKSGLKGEERTSIALQELPSSYKVFRSVQINTSEGNAEIDHLVVAENGIFIVEVKNHKGNIVGNEADYKWTQHKVGRNGGRYSNQMGNPVKQVRRQTFILSKFLKQNSIPTWVEGVVFFCNPKVSVNVYSERTAVITDPDELKKYLMNYVPKHKVSKLDIEKTKKLIEEGALEYDAV
ncbi:nuclease-related domain-containing protein [Virgibacillus sp. W0430]|uniref:nuclease-related domain-containing protein n=1 Tax=Virgibacillus sp. W0430 TaxID=3391580 RepID=UPI003F484EA5